MTMKILIVDDDKDLLVLIQRFLMREYSEIKAISAISAQDALRQLETENFDAVVCDFYLGKNEMTGLELLEWLRKTDLDLPFIMFTGRSREEVAIKALNLGANFYLKKDVEDFENLFRELVHHITAAVETRYIEDALADSEARFRAMFELAPIGVARVSPDGKLLEVNTSLSQILGYSMNELVGMDVFELTTSEDAELERRLNEEMLQGLRDSYQMEKRFIRKDGGLVWGHLSVSVVLNTRGEPVFAIGMVEDVTELKRERESLRESEAKFRAIFEEAGIGITIAVEDHIVDVNPAYAKLLGYSRDELSGMNIRAFSNQEDHEIDRKLYFETIERGHNTYDMRKRYIHKDGTPIWVDLTVSVVRSEEGSPEFIFGMVQDVTEQVKMINTIEENEQKFRELFDISPIAIELFDPDGNVLDANNAALITFGLDSIEDFLGFNLFKDPNLPDEIKEEMQKGNTTRFEIEFDFEWVAKHQMYVSSKTGKKHLDMLSTPLLSADGSTITGYLSQIQDISTRKIIEKQLVERTKELELIFNSVPAGIWYKDTENNFILVNDAGAKSVGLTPEDLNGKSSYDVFPEFAEKYYQDDLEVINSENPKLGIIEPLVTTTGERLWVRTDKVPLFDSEGTVDGVLVIVTNITDLKETQDALKNSEEIHRSMVNLSPDVNILTDLEGVVLSCSAAIEELTGYSPETMIGLDYKNIPFMPQDELLRFADAFVQILSEQKIISIETTFSHRNGTQRTAEVRIGLLTIDGELRGAQAIAIDITERKLADDAIRESEGRYRSIFDNALTGVVRVGLEDGKVLLCNDSAARILGFDTVDEVIENYITMEHFVDPNFRERILQRAPETGGKLEYQTEITKRNGEIFWIQASTTINEEEAYADTVFLDVTAQKQADAALRKSEERYRTLVEQIHDGYVVLQDGKVAFANQIIADTFGYTLNEFIGIPFTELVAPEDIDMITERYHRRLVEAPLRERNDVRAVRKDGTRFVALLSDSPLEFNGKPATLTTVIDVTEQRKLEQETQYLANLIDNVSDAIISTDEKFIIRSWNKAAEEIYGWKVEEVLGKPLVGLLHSETIGITIDDSQKELVTTGRWDGETKQKTKDGRGIHVQSSVSLLEDKDGNPYGAVAVYSDITERVLIEEALRESEQRNRMIVDAMSDLVIVFDSEGRYSEYYAQDESLLVQPWNQLKGKKPGEFLSPELSAQHNAHIKHTRETGESIVQEFELETRDGLKWLQATMMFHEDTKEFVSSVMDITERKTAEEALRKSEHRNRLIVDTMSDLVLVHDSEGRYVDYFGKSESLLVRPWDEMKGKKIEEIVPPDIAAQYHEYVKKVRETGESITYDFVLEFGSSPRWLQSTTMLHEDGKSIVVAVKDITAQREAEDSLKMSEAENRNLIENIQDGILITQDGVIVFANEVLAQMLGYEINEIVGIHIPDLFLPEDREWVIDRYRQRIAGKSVPSDYDLRFLHKNESCVYAHVKVSTFNYRGKLASIAAIMDVTKQREAEKETQYLASLIANVSDGIISTDENFIIRSWNKAAEEIYGWKADEAIGKPLLEILQSESDRIVIDISMDELQETSRWDGEAVHRRKDGRRIHIKSTSSLLRDKVGNQYGTVAVISDITQRKETEEKLKESKERYRTLFETMTEGVVYQDSDGYVLDANPEAERILGLSIEQMRGRDSIDPRWKAVKSDGSDFPGEEHPAMVALKTGLQVRDVVMGVFNLRGDDYVWININAVPLFKPDDSKPFQVYTTFNDITAKRQTDKAKRQTEDALKESEAKFRSIFEQAAVGVARVNLRGNIIQTNRKLTQMLGYDEGSLEGVNVFEITTDDDSEIQKQFGAELIAGKRDSYSMEKRYFRKDDSIMWGRLTVSASRNNLGDIDFTIGVLEDITERKQLQETLQINEEKFRNIVKNAGVGITIVDSEDHILEANQKYQDLIGYSLDELKQMKIAEFTYPEDAERDRILFTEVVDGKRNSFQMEKRYIRKDGATIWVNLTVSVVRNSEGVINFIIGIVHDITDRKQTSSTEQEVFKQVERQRQELSNFAHMISHDLNNNFIKLRLMLKELETEENRYSIDRIGKLLVEISNLTKHSVKIADAGLTIGARVDVDLGEILREIAETHVPSEIEFNSECSHIVRADETKLAQVFVNIIENAVVHGRPKKIEVSCEALEDGVNLTIANDGIQIPLEIRPKIFDYGFSSEDFRHGMGLAFVKKLIEAHGWKITLRDSPETAFDIWIPTRDIHG